MATSVVADIVMRVMRMRDAAGTRQAMAAQGMIVGGTHGMCVSAAIDHSSHDGQRTGPSSIVHIMEGHAPLFQSERVAPVAKPKNYNQTVACVCILGQGGVITNLRNLFAHDTPARRLPSGLISMTIGFLAKLASELHLRRMAPAPLLLFHIVDEHGMR